jgi:hypothetical protein
MSYLVAAYQLNIFLFGRNETVTLDILLLQGVHFAKQIIQLLLHALQHLILQEESITLPIHLYR